MLKHRVVALDMTTSDSANNTVATVYYAPWCPFCQRLLKNLDRTDTPYDRINVDEDADAAKWVESVNDGNRVVPTVRYSDDSHATNPSASEVREKVSALS